MKSSAEHAAVDRDAREPAVDAEDHRDAAAAQQAHRRAITCGVARRLEHDDRTRPHRPRPPRPAPGSPHVARAEPGHQRRRLPVGRRAAGDPHLEPLQPQLHRRQHADRAVAEHQRASRTPRLPFADGPRMPHGARADRGGSGQHADRAQAGRHRHEVLGQLGDEVAREAVQRRDAALGVVARQARVGRIRRARAHRARTTAARRWPTRSPRAEAGPSRSTRPSSSWPEHQGGAVRRCDPEVAADDLAVGAATADLDDPEQHAVVRRGRLGHLLDARRAGGAGINDERLHQPSGIRRTAPSEADPTSAA